MKMDRGGRTLEDYRQLYWDGLKRIAALEATIKRVEGLPDKWTAKTKEPPGPDFIWTKGYDAGLKQAAFDLTKALTGETK